VRTFIALELSPETRAALGKIAADLKPVIGRMTWVKPESMHLTLKFLGEVDEGRADEIGARLKRICSEAKPFGFDIVGLGCFPNPFRPRVIWAGIVGDIAPARELQNRIDSELEPLGFEPERRGFSPHVTLARVKGGIDVGVLKNAIEENSGRCFGSERITEVVFMRSRLLPEGAVYTPLARFELGR
jgi:2'-5' RNA ligase